MRKNAECEHRMDAPLTNDEKISPMSGSLPGVPWWLPQRTRQPPASSFATSCGAPSTVGSSHSLRAWSTWASRTVLR
jgi:hypothetical protein